MEGKAVRNRVVSPQKLRSLLLVNKRALVREKLRKDVDFASFLSGACRERPRLTPGLRPTPKRAGIGRPLLPLLGGATCVERA